MEHTWNEAAERWLKRRKGGKWFSYEERYVKRLTEYLDGRSLPSIRRADVADIRDDMLDKYQPGTVNRYLTVLRSILLKARDDWEWIDRVPKIERLKETERKEYLTREQAERLLRMLPSPRDEMARFAIATGLRNSNVRLLRWEWVNLDEGTVSLPGSEMKNGKDFVAPLSDMALSVLLRQKGKHPEWVFPQMSGPGKGKPVTQMCNRTWREACRRAGVPGTRFHDLRHTFASWHIQSGTHVSKLQALGGWSDPKMVQRYAHLGVQHLKEEVEATNF